MTYVESSNLFGGVELKDEKVPLREGKQIIDKKDLEG